MVAVLRRPLAVRYAIVTTGLRIAVVSDAVPERNGVGAYYHDLADHLCERVERIELFAPGFRDGRREPRFGLPLPGDDTQRVCLPPLLRLHRQLRALRPQIVVVPTPGPYGLAGAALARRFGAALVTGFHTDYLQLSRLYWHHHLQWIPQGYFGLCHRLLFGGKALVTVNSAEMEQAARAQGAVRIERVGTPIPRDFLTRPPVPLGPRLRTVLFAGRLAAEKNVPGLLDAAAELGELEFRIAGDGPQRSAIEARARQLGNVRCLGWLGRRQLREQIDDCDLLILPSQVESFGTIALEGMARRRPVLVSSRCGIRDWTELESGLFAMHQGESIVTAIRRVAALPSVVREHTATLGRRNARRLIEWHVDHWLDLMLQHARTHRA